MSKQYRKKPVIIEAEQLLENMTWESIADWCGGKIVHSLDNNSDGIEITTLEGTMLALPNDYIIEGVNGEFYPCKPDIFEKTYEEVVGE